MIGSRWIFLYLFLIWLKWVVPNASYTDRRILKINITGDVIIVICLWILINILIDSLLLNWLIYNIKIFITQFIYLLKVLDFYNLSTFINKSFIINFLSKIFIHSFFITYFKLYEHTQTIYLHLYHLTIYSFTIFYYRSTSRPKKMFSSITISW